VDLLKSQSVKRISFGRIPEIVEAPDLLNVQLESWENFLQTGHQPNRRRSKGLQAVFKMNFPVTDARENFLLEFVEYYVEKPKYSVAECEERGLTYACPIKAKLRLSQKAEDGKSYVNTIEQDVYLGNLPTMTHRGTFIINGAERVVVSQLHRSPGVGGVLDGYQQRDVRLHRQEEEVSCDDTSPGPGILFR
jgi:DNA-directed RNA polymerase subunit beta